MTKQLKALAEAATKGEWAVVDGHYPSFKELTGPSFSVSVVMFATDLTDADTDQREADLQYIAFANPERILALIAENERLTHSRKDAEPVGWKCFHCVKESCYSPTPARQEDQRDTHPPDADKLLQQALEALEYRLQQTRPIHQADSVMEAIRTYLEGKK